ncbi:MAG: HD domain-containing protein [Candidatus Gracilibacteria bacterium]|nr:HD domain-containing protein [bacterium]MDZ4217265.1 HD domain-containing protein [Candidatus Gracilibacteria bacterium]
MNKKDPFAERVKMPAFPDLERDSEEKWTSPVSHFYDTSKAILCVVTEKSSQRKNPEREKYKSQSMGRFTKGDCIQISEQVMIDEISHEYAAAGVPFEACGKGIHNTRIQVKRVLKVCGSLDKKLQNHLISTAAIAESALNNSAFINDIYGIVISTHEDYDHPRRTEMMMLSNSKVEKEEIILAMQLHDIGKLAPRIRAVINAKEDISGRPELLSEILRHPGTLDTCQELRLEEPTTLLILLFHHYRRYCGFDPNQMKEILKIPKEVTVKKRTDLDRYVPVKLMLAICFDILAAMLEHRWYKEHRYVFLSESAISSFRKKYPFDWSSCDENGRPHKSIESEIQDNLPPEIGEKISQAFLKWVRNDWDNIQQLFKGEKNHHFIDETLPENESTLLKPRTEEEIEKVKKRMRSR